MIKLFKKRKKIKIFALSGLPIIILVFILLLASCFGIAQGVDEEQSSSSSGSLSQDEFINEIAIYAIDNYKKSKILPSVMIAQAIEESGWGTSTLAQKAYNFFGMKKGGNYSGKTIKLGSGTYRCYDSLDDGINGYYKFISSPRYSNLKSITNYRLFASKLQADGWNPNKSYVDTLINHINNYKLYKYDDMDSSSQLIKSKKGVALSNTAIKYFESGNHAKYREIHIGNYRKNNPKTLDCSSFVSWIYFHAGYGVGEQTTDWFHNQGKVICNSRNYSNVLLQPGDLIFESYGCNRTPWGHIGLYLGNGKAAFCDTGKGTTRRSVSRNHFYQARRF